MLQKPWFKMFIWFMATFFFFLAAGVIISMFKPGPSETEIMKFMEGMMSAMDRSMMGVAMGIEKDGPLSSIVKMSNSIALPVILISVFAGIGIRLWIRGDKSV